MRTPIIAGNWKMNCDNEQASQLANSIVEKVGKEKECTVVLCPPATALSIVCERILSSNIKAGAQNFFWKESGAHTGEISAKMILSCGAEYVIIGHSERRGRYGKTDIDPEIPKIFTETDASVNKKVKAALSSSLNPIVCCGETFAERKAGKTDGVVTSQVRAMLNGLSPQEISKIVIAYEPVWAIGTGEACNPAEANRVCGLIRSIVAEVGSKEVAENVRILYGGTVNPENIHSFMDQPEIDGGLVGGASLNADGFAAIVNAAASKVGGGIECTPL